MKLETLAIHAGADADPATGSVAPPIHLSTNFIHGPASEETYGYMYIRDKNPTQDRLETALSALEGGEAALAFSSGMGATSAFFQSLDPGTHVIIPEDVYVHVRLIATTHFKNWQLEFTTVDTQSIAAIARGTAEHAGDLGGNTVKPADEDHGHRGCSKHCASGRRIFSR